MRYITKDELRIIWKAVERIENDTFDEQYKTQVEMALGDTMDVVNCGGIKTLKYSNVLLIGIEEISKN